MSNSGGQTSVQKSEPWEGAKPFYLDIYNRAQQLYNQGTPYVDTFEEFNQGQRSALDSIYARGMTGSPLIGDSGAALRGMVNSGLVQAEDLISLRGLGRGRGR